MATKVQMIEEIRAITKKIWDEKTLNLVKEPKWNSKPYIDLGWHGGYQYSIVDGVLHYPFSERMDRLSKYGLQMILNALREVVRRIDTIHDIIELGKDTDAQTLERLNKK